MTKTATIILPTTADRGLLLPLVVQAIQQQQVTDFELFIIGDGVDALTRTVIEDLVRQDDRIRFFDHPKHPRRGEEYRHAALQKAQGRIVAYCCDRDLWLPNHLTELDRHLQSANFVSGYYYRVMPNQTLDAPLRNSRLDQTVLSAIGHTLALYNALPVGWHTTPPEWPTDVYMSRKLLAHPDCRPVFGYTPTFLYVKRGDHPGLSTPERYAELAYWANRMQEGHLQADERDAFGRVAQERNRMVFSWMQVRGQPISAIPTRLWRKTRRWLGLPAVP